MSIDERIGAMAEMAQGYQSARNQVRALERILWIFVHKNGVNDYPREMLFLRTDFENFPTTAFLEFEKKPDGDVILRACHGK